MEHDEQEDKSDVIGAWHRHYLLLNLHAMNPPELRMSYHYNHAIYLSRIVIISETPAKFSHHQKDEFTDVLLLLRR